MRATKNIFPLNTDHAIIRSTKNRSPLCYFSNDNSFSHIFTMIIQTPYAMTLN